MDDDAEDALVDVDWGRIPTSEAEETLVSNAFSALLNFYEGMPSVAQRYAENAVKSCLRSLVATVVLNAWDAYLIVRKGRGLIRIENNDEAAAFAARHGFQWLDLSNAISALGSVGVLVGYHSFAPERSDDPDFVLAVGEGLGDNLEMLKAEELDNSQPLDVHRWSDHPEANAFVDHIYAEHFASGNARIRKKHIKVLLLDLFVRWTVDPSLKTGLSRNVNSYEPGSRYNALHISKMMPEIADRLMAAGLLRQSIGYRPYESQKGQDRSGRTTRIWPTSRLIRMFEDARFGPLDIRDHADREVIILRNVDPKNDEKQVEIEYEDTGDIKRMRFYVKAYNNLLHRTFIDIPTLKAGFIDLTSEPDGPSRRLQVNQHDKFTRRIFNRGSFDKGGRFWGGWWQRCPKEWRGKIFIDDKPTSELDYSGLHIVMLYAREGIDYWETVNADPYVIDLPGYDGTPEELRAICKQLVLVALNAKNDDSTFHAFRDDAATGSPEKGMSNDFLSKILDLLKEKHRPIAHKLANDAGIDLMNQDAKIAERIITHFTRKGIPILAIHDSFIVPYGQEEELYSVMHDAFTSVMLVDGSKVKEVTSRPRPVLLSPQSRSRLQPPPLQSLELNAGGVIYLFHRKLHTASSVDNPLVSAERKYLDRHHPKRTARYQASLKGFQAWLAENRPVWTEERQPADS